MTDNDNSTRTGSYITKYKYENSLVKDIKSKKENDNNEIIKTK